MRVWASVEGFFEVDGELGTGGLHEAVGADGGGGPGVVFADAPVFAVEVASGGVEGAWPISFRCGRPPGGRRRRRRGDFDGALAGGLEDDAAGALPASARASMMVWQWLASEVELNPGDAALHRDFTGLQVLHVAPLRFNAIVRHLIRCRVPRAGKGGKAELARTRNARPAARAAGAKPTGHASPASSSAVAEPPWPPCHRLCV